MLPFSSCRDLNKLSGQSKGRLSTSLGRAEGAVLGHGVESRVLRGSLFFHCRLRAAEFKNSARAGDLYSESDPAVLLARCIGVQKTAPASRSGVPFLPVKRFYASACVWRWSIGAGRGLNVFCRGGNGPTASVMLVLRRLHEEHCWGWVYGCAILVAVQAPFSCGRASNSLLNSKVFSIHFSVGSERGTAVTRPLDGACMEPAVVAPVVVGSGTSLGEGLFARGEQL